MLVKSITVRVFDIEGKTSSKSIHFPVYLSGMHSFKKLVDVNHVQFARKADYTEIVTELCKKTNSKGKECSHVEKELRLNAYYPDYTNEITADLSKVYNGENVMLHIALKIMDLKMAMRG